MRLGLSQQDLASLAGVSRQTIGGVESGQTALSVTVALRLTHALGCRVEDLFWLEQESVTLTAIPASSFHSSALNQVSLSKVGDRWIAYPLIGDDSFHLELIPADGEIVGYDHDGHVIVKLLDELPNLVNTVVVAGCAPSLSVWAKAAERWHPELRVQLRFANSMEALTRLMRGEVHIAGIHRYCPKTQTYNVPFVQHVIQDKTAVLINLGIWDEGLLVATHNPKQIQSVADLVRPDISIVNREPGSGSRDVLDQGLAGVGIPTEMVAGFDRIVSSHHAVAQAIASGEADTGVSTASVAEMFHLGFIPVRQSRYDLVTFKTYLKDPIMKRLLGTLGHRRVISQLEVLGKYDTQLTGDIVATIEGNG
jgi:molybdate-binding protein/DNA-binding XRE family transcriptional regulator